MRKRYRVLWLAALVVGLAVPLGFALSVDSTDSSALFLSRAPAVDAAAPLAMIVTVHPARSAEYVSPSPADKTLPDAATLMLLGTVLVGLAAAVRKVL